MQLHFKKVREEKKTAQKFHGSGNLNENTEGGKDLQDSAPVKKCE